MKIYAARLYSMPLIPGTQHICSIAHSLLVLPLDTEEGLCKSRHSSGTLQQKLI